MTTLKRALLSCLLFFTACGGPPHPLKVGVKERVTDVILASKETAQPGPAPPLAANLNPGFPGFLQPPPVLRPSSNNVPVTETTACPASHPFDAPKNEALTNATAPPVAGTYVFRNEGRFEIRGPSPSSGTHPSMTSREISNVGKTNRDFMFDVTEEQGTFTTTSYQVVPNATAEVAPLVRAATPDAGIFLTRVVSRLPNGSSDSFIPNPALKLVPFPIQSGIQWDTAGTDPLTQITMSFHGRVGIGPDAALIPKARVNACGEPLDAWWIEVTQGQIIGPSKNMTFSARYAIAPQFGGLSVMDAVSLSGTDRGASINSGRLATINRPPALPAQ